MTKRAVLQTYQEILDQLTDEMLTVVEEEFGGGVLGSIASAGVGTVTKRLQEEMETQGRVVVEYAAARARGEDTRRHERRFLETNPVYQRYDGDDGDELESHLLSHFEQVGSDLEPLIASERSDFWLAMRDEYDREAAEALVDRHFDQAETFKRFRGGIFTSSTLAGKVISVVEEGESRLRDDLYTRIDEVYESS